MLVNRRFDKLMIVLAVAGVAAYGILQPRYRLREQVPKEFLQEAHSLSPQKRAQEERIARAYWKCALNQIQWRYSYGHRLPELPPPDFAVASQEFGTANTDPASRARYWRKLQEVWYMPTVWQREYSWDSRSVKDSLISTGDWLNEQIGRVTGRP